MQRRGFCLACTDNVERQQRACKEWVEFCTTTVAGLSATRPVDASVDMPPVDPCSIGGASNDCPPSRRRLGRADGGRLLSSWGVLADTSCCIGDCAMTGRGGGDDEEAACDGDVCSNDS